MIYVLFRYVAVIILAGIWIFPGFEVERNKLAFIVAALQNIKLAVIGANNWLRAY
jgi:flagellar biogenesis protein FliO